MATQKEEVENFMKMFRLVTGVGTDSLRVEFDKQFSPPSLATTLVKHEPKLKKLNTDRRQTSKQMSLLFPSSGSPTSKDFDVTLMICLIRNLTRVTAPSSGFDKLPSISETTVGADMARIKYYRNMLAHADNNQIPTVDFNFWWQNLSDAIVRLGGGHYQKECDNIKSLQMLSDVEFKTLLSEVVLFKNIYNEELRELKEKIEEFQDVRDKICDVETEMAAVFRNTEDIRAETQNIKIEMDSVSRNTEGVRLKVEKTETKMSEVIPANIQDQIKKQLELWQKQDKILVLTGATEHVLECITENSCVTVTGNPGVGKTFIVRHVALIMKGEGYTVVPTCIPKDIRDFTKPGGKTLFVVDDICGHYTLNQKYLDDWKLMLSDIALLLDNNHCKIIATCRLQVFKDEKFKDLSIFSSNECNLNSEKLCLTSDEKTSLAKKYFADQASKVSQMSDQYEFFPLLCSLYDKDKFSDLSQFFSQPFDCYKQEIDHLLKGDEGRYKYCVLALVVMFNKKLSEDHLSGDYSKIIENTLVLCQLNKGTSVECLKDALHTLEGTFVVKDDDCYKTIHDKLFDFLANYFGDQMLKCIVDNATSEFVNERILWNTKDNTETDIGFSIYLPDKCLDMYISRLVNDWSDGKVLRLFVSRNHKSPKFIVKLLNHIKQHETSFQVKLANVTVDNIYHDTTLLLSCFVGNANLTQWILDNTVYNGRCRVLCKSVTCFNKLSQCFYSDSIVNKCRNDGTSPVYIACQKGHLSVLDRLIECKADINKCTNNDRSPVYIACEKGHVSVLDRLIECKADINKCNNNGTSPVYIACQEGHLSVLDRLIECKADINKCINDGRSPVYTACQEGHLSILDRLIECKADINKCNNNGASPVYIACETGHVNILNTLLESKADVNKCTKVGNSPLHIACYNNRIDVVLVLLKLYKKNKVMIDLCNDLGNTPLYYACYKGFVQIVTPLLQHGANPHQCNNVGKSPLQVADNNGHVDVVTAIK